jgi:hypothetical protein
MKHIIRWLYFRFVFKQEFFAQEILAFCIPGEVKDKNYEFILAQISKIQTTDYTLLAAGKAKEIIGYNLVDFSSTYEK